MWERFSYYGMRTLLVPYMVKYLLLPGHGGVIGLGAVWSPRLATLRIADLWSLYRYLTPLFGGRLAVRVAVCAGALHAHPWQRRLQAQYLDRGRRPLRAGRPSGQDVMAALAQSSSELWSG
jgi:hypothetical protein